MNHAECSSRDVLRMTGSGLAHGLAAGARYSTALAAGPPPSIPGPYPGRVVGIYHSGVVNFDDYTNPAATAKMIRQGLLDLTGAGNYVAAWRRFVQPGDVVGIKINPNGNYAMLSTPWFFTEIVNGLLLAGIKPKDIIVYERYQETLDNVTNWFPGWVRQMYAASGWDAVQQDISGYDPAYWVDFAKVLPGYDLGNQTARRSYLAQFLTRSVTKVVNLATLKTHEAAGVTLSLKNLSHGMVNNVNRSHAGGENRVDQFIPAVVNHPVIRGKVVLNIVDGIHGLYYGGPVGERQWVWDHKTIYFATDPVALDRICWKVIDDKRASLNPPQVPIANASPDGKWFTFPNTQPEHILNAGALGLGVSDLDNIDLRLRTIG